MLFDIAPERRILIVTGHYGSGKTEFAVSLALQLAQNNVTGRSRIALCDLDVVNPYFRSRERADILEKAGVKVYGGMYGTGTTAEIPELSAAIRTPLEDEDCFTIVDVGGNDSGARILAQFMKYFTENTSYSVLVVNGSRPETRDTAGVIEQMSLIEQGSGLKIDAIVSNTHMLTLTTKDEIFRGVQLCKSVSNISGKKLLCACYPEKYVALSDIESIPYYKIPLGMYMRESWLDK